jgi:hypothetical protein
MSKLRYWIALWLMRLAAKISYDPVIYPSIIMKRISWDAWEWDHDMDFDRDTQEYKAADKLLRRISTDAEEANKLLHKIRFGNKWID